MNTVHWHLLLNHLPVMGTVFGTLLLLAGFILKGNTDVKRTALGLLIFSALMAIPAFLTGEGAEHAVEKLPGVAKSVIEEHEDTGKLFFGICIGLGVLSIFTFFADKVKSRLTSTLYIATFIMAIGTSIYAKQVATGGGEIRHTEIRNNGQVNPADNSAEESKEHDDKD